MANNVVASAPWTCDAPIPNVKTNRRAPCGSENPGHVRVCAECGAPRGFKTEQNKDKNMTTPTATVKPSTTSSKPTNGAKPAAKPTEAKPTGDAKPTDAADAAVATDAKPEDKAPRADKDPRVKFYSTKADTDYSVRIRESVLGKHGAPMDPWGVPMVQRAAGAPGTGGEKSNSGKAAREAAKAAEVALLAGMTDEQKLAYAKAKREKDAAEKADKKKAEREALKAQLRKEIEMEEAAAKGGK